MKIVNVSGEELPLGETPSMMLTPDPYSVMLTTEYGPAATRGDTLRLLDTANRHVKLFPTPQEWSLFTDKLAVMEALHTALNRGFLTPDSLQQKVRLVPTAHVKHDEDPNILVEALRQASVLFD